MSISKIAVVIPTYNRKAYLARVLENLLSQEGEFKIFPIVVVDGSTDGTIDLLKSEFPEVKIIQGTGSWWYTKCINEGIRASLELNVDYVLLLNDDIELCTGYISILLKSGKHCSDKAIIGSISVTIEVPHKITFSGIKKIHWWRAKQVLYHKFLENFNKEVIFGLHYSEILPGRGMMIPVKIIQRIGLFDEALRQYGSDDEFTLRARKNNYEVYINWDALVYSHNNLTGKGASFKKEPIIEYLATYFNKHSRNYMGNYVRLYFKYGNKVLLPLTLIIIFLGNFKTYLKYKYLVIQSK